MDTISAEVKMIIESVLAVGAPLDLRESDLLSLYAMDSLDIGIVQMEILIELKSDIPDSEMQEAKTVEDIILLTKKFL